MIARYFNHENPRIALRRVFGALCVFWAIAYFTLAYYAFN